MAGPIPPGPGIAQLQGGHAFGVGTTKGKGQPSAPHATGAWLRLMGELATHLPTAQRQAAIFRRRALQAIR